MPDDPLTNTTQSTRSLVAPVADRIIYMCVLLDVAPARAFEYFVEPSLLTQWLAASAEVEAEVDGKYELFWQPDDRENDSTIGCRITAFTTSQLLAFQWRSPLKFKAFANGADPLTHVTVSFFPEGQQTRIHLVHSGWRSSADWEAARMWQANAWDMAFNHLASLRLLS